MQHTLFPEDPPQTLEIPVADGWLRYRPGFLEPAAATALFEYLRAEIPWSQEHVHIAGRRIPMPRLTAWFGDPGRVYSYSGKAYTPLPWLPALQALRERVGRFADTDFNSVLANLYRDGQDSVSWHADDEPELGRDPLIASISLGAVRRFQLRHRKRRDQRVDLDLEPGSLLLMGGALQHHWRHALPKTARPVAARINLTFRTIR